MLGFFINLSGLFSIFSAPFSAAASAGGAIASARVQQATAERARATMFRDFDGLSVTVPRDGLPPRDLVFLRDYDRWFRVVDGQPHIPRVKRKLP